jgi:hypothetical protein
MRGEAGHEWDNRFAVARGPSHDGAVQEFAHQIAQLEGKHAQRSLQESDQSSE